MLGCGVVVAFWPKETKRSADGAPAEATAPETVADPDISGSTLPELALTSFQGDPMTVERDGRPLVINFWSSTCAPCIAEMPMLQELFVENEASVDFLRINTLDWIEGARARVEQSGVTYEVAQDPRGRVLRQLGGSGLPRTIVVNAAGTVVASKTGPIDAEELRGMIALAS